MQKRFVTKSKKKRKIPLTMYSKHIWGKHFFFKIERPIIRLLRPKCKVPFRYEEASYENITIFFCLEPR